MRLADTAPDSSFVEQEDALIGVLTVRETITYALKLYLPGADGDFVNNRVNDVITSLGLDSCSNNKIGTPIQRGVSGGQKRRVSIGCSMVCFP
jgi:ABC-type multidrug transport system ATPase subunit